MKKKWLRIFIFIILILFCFNFRFRIQLIDQTFLNFLFFPIEYIEVLIVKMVIANGININYLVHNYNILYILIIGIFKLGYLFLLAFLVEKLIYLTTKLFRHRIR